MNASEEITSNLPRSATRRDQAPITVRRASVADAAAYARIMGHPEVLPGLLQVPYTNESLWAARLAQTAEPGKLDLFLVAELDGQVAGNVGLHPAMPLPRRRHAAHLGMAVDRAHWGQGVGSALLGAVCDYADNWGHYLRLELGVYVDTLMMARLHPKPPHF
jgi:putative acetyltransferase